MYEFHGWANIRQTYKNVDLEEEKIEFIVGELKEYITKLQMINWIFDVKAFNGEYHLIVSGFTNHAYPASKQLFDLYKYIAQIALGSYGILYVHNEEDNKGFDNKFRVYVLSRGNIVEKVDPFFSPFIPTVEDAYLSD